MTEKEKKIILNNYYDLYAVTTIDNEYNYNSVNTLSYILDRLNLKLERIKIENELNIENTIWNSTQKETFTNLFNILLKYNEVLEYKDFINDIYYDFFKYDMYDKCTKEHQKNIKACLNILNYKLED